MKRELQRLAWTTVCLWVVYGAGAQQYVISTVAGGAPPPTPVVATSASIGPALGVATDDAGNVYFTAWNCVFKLDATGVMTRVAGNGRAGYSGDGGLAILAQLNYPWGLAVDVDGSLFIADSLNSRIRRVSPGGIITTLAGNGRSGYSGDGGPAVSAQLYSPCGVAVDGQGNIYIADTSNHRVRTVSIGGIITTVAGTAVAGYSGDGGPSINAQLTYPYGVAVDGHGSVFIADSQNIRIRKVSPNGIITTEAGTGARGFAGDGGPATSAQLNYPQSVTLDRQGNLYIADSANNRMRKVSTSSIISTVAGAAAGYSGDGGPASSALLNALTGVAVDALGNFYIADRNNNRVRKVTAGGIIGTAAGNGTPGYSGDGGPATGAQFNTPWDVAADEQGNLFVADTLNNRIRKVSPAGIVTTLAGNGTAGYSGDGGPGGSAQLNAPQGVAVDTQGNLFIADRGNRRARRVTLGGTIGTVAGSGQLGARGDGGPATSAELDNPYHLTVDRLSNLYISDLPDAVRKVTPDGIITTMAAGQLSDPAGLVADGQANLFIADTFNNRIREVSAAGIVTTVAGTGKEGHTGDGGPATSAEISLPEGVALDGSGNLFIADSDNNCIRKVAPDGIITTVAGTGTPGYSGDGGAAVNAQLNGPRGVAADAHGNVYFVDNGAIRLLQPTNHSILLSAVADAASGMAGPLSPGKIVVLYGGGLGPANLTLSQPVNGLFPNELAGATVSFNGTAAPILYTSATQIAAIVPYGITGTSALVTVSYQGETSAPVTVPVAAAVPGLFTLNQTGAGQAAAVNAADSSINTAANPVKIGGYISLFATGEGQTTPSGKDGRVPPADGLPQPVLKVSVTVGGIPAVVQYAGAVPNQVAGLMQVNIQIPSGVQPGGYVPVVLQVGSASTVAGAVWIAVAGN